MRMRAWRSAAQQGQLPPPAGHCPSANVCCPFTCWVAMWRRRTPMNSLRMGSPTGPPAAVRKPDAQPETCTAARAGCGSGVGTGAGTGAGSGGVSARPGQMLKSGTAVPVTSAMRTGVPTVLPLAWWQCVGSAAHHMPEAASICVSSMLLGTAYLCTS